MNRASLLVLSLALAAATAIPASATVCTSPCQVSVMPEVQSVALPLSDWMYSAGSPPSVITIVDAPVYGSWNATTETYTPGANFWAIGLDRLVLQFDSAAPKTILIVAASAVAETVNFQNFETFGELGDWDYDGDWNLASSLSPRTGTEMTIGSTGRAFSDITIRGTAPIGTGGGVTIRPGVPCTGGTCVGGTAAPVDVLVINNFLKIEMKVVSWEIFVRAKAIHSSYDEFCDPETPCVTDWLELDDPEAYYALSALLGPATSGGPADTFSLRFTIDEEGSEPAAHYEVSSLPWITLGEEGLMEVGELGAAATAYNSRLDDIRVWHLELADGETSLTGRYDRFHNGLKDYGWTTLGTVSVVGSSDYWAQADLYGLTNTSSSRNSLIDYIANYKKRLRIHLNLDTTQLNLANNDSVVPFISYGNAATGGTSRVVDLFVRKLSGVYYVRARAVNDDASVTATDYLPLSVGTNQIGLYWSSEAGGGRLQIAVGSTLGDSESLTNGARTAGNVAFGAHLVNVATPLASSLRLVDIDDIAVVY